MSGAGRGEDRGPGKEEQQHKGSWWGTVLCLDRGGSGVERHIHTSTGWTGEIGVSSVDGIHVRILVELVTIVMQDFTPGVGECTRVPGNSLYHFLQMQVNL